MAEEWKGKSNERWEKNSLSEILHGREEGLEIEDDGTAQRQATEGLPVDTEVDAREGEFCLGELDFAVFLVGIAGRHEEGGVDLEAPGAALDGVGGGKLGEVAVGSILVEW